MSESMDRPFIIKTEIKQEPEDTYEYNNNNNNYNENFMNSVKYLKQEIKDFAYNNNEVIVKQEPKEVKLEPQPQDEPTEIDLNTKFKKKVNNSRRYYSRHSNNYYSFEHACYMCHRKFRTYWSLQYHWQTTLNMCNSIFKCWRCHNVYNTRNALKRHISKCNLHITSNLKKLNEIKANESDVKVKLESDDVVVKAEQEDNQVNDMVENLNNSNMSSTADVDTIKQKNVMNVNPITLVNMKTALKSVAESKIDSNDDTKSQLNPFNLLLVMDQYLGDVKEGESILKPMPLPIEIVKVENDDDSG